MRRHLGSIIGLITTAIMALDAATADLRNVHRAEDIAAYATFAGIGVVGIMIAHRWYPDHVAWAFLVPAFVCILAGVRYFEQFWAYAIAFAVAGAVGIVGRAQAPDKPPDTMQRSGIADSDQQE